MDQVVVILEWQFSPPGYFEEPINVTRDDYTMIIGDGKVEARIDSAIYDRNPSMRQALHDAVNGRFLGVQLLTHKAYNLSRSTMTRLHPDGRRDISVEAEPSPNFSHRVGAAVGWAGRDGCGRAVGDWGSRSVVEPNFGRATAACDAGRGRYGKGGQKAAARFR
jgi:hypothetical protein